MTYTLTIHIEGKGLAEDHEEFQFSDGNTKDYTDGETVTLTAVPEEDWEFVEWSGDESSTNIEITFDMDEDKTLNLLFKEDLYISEEDVRAALNNISEEELSSLTIIQKIKDGQYYAEKRGLDGYEKERFIRAYAALKSFIVSNTYSQVDFGDIRVRKEWQRTLEELEKELEEIASISLVIDDTFMFDERPSKRLLSKEELVERPYRQY